MFPFSKYVSICSVLGIGQALFNIRGHQYVRTYPVWYKRQYAELLLSLHPDQSSLTFVLSVYTGICLSVFYFSSKHYGHV